MKLFDRLLYWVVCICILTMTFLTVVNRIEMDRRKDQRDVQWEQMDKKMKDVENAVQEVKASTQKSEEN